MVIACDKTEFFKDNVTFVIVSSNIVTFNLYRVPECHLMLSIISISSFIRFEEPVVQIELYPIDTLEVLGNTQSHFLTRGLIRIQELEQTPKITGRNLTKAK